MYNRSIVVCDADEDRKDSRGKQNEIAENISSRPYKSAAFQCVSAKQRTECKRKFESISDNNGGRQDGTLGAFTERRGF